jgi:hypothetical protein
MGDVQAGVEVCLQKRPEAIGFSGRPTLLTSCSQSIFFPRGFTSASVSARENPLKNLSGGGKFCRKCA